MNKVRIYISFFLLSLSFGMLNAQRIKVEEDALVGSHINVPIKVEVKGLNESKSFQMGSAAMSYDVYVSNETYYPYTVHLMISEIDNLVPVKVDEVYKVNPGRKKVITLKIQDVSRSVHYFLNYTYALGVQGEDIEPEYPYLIPVKAPFAYATIDTESKEILENYFMMNRGDTVYAARKGRIVATPDLHDNAFRISKHNTVEVLHKDKTMMVYENLDPESVFIEAGKMVYPGQAIGVLNEEAYLKLILYQNTGDGYLEAMNIFYYLDEQNIEPFSERMKDFPVVYPETVIFRELTKKELKQLKKGTLVL